MSSLRTSFLRRFRDKYFSLLGGGLKSGEDNETAIYRDLKEELGINKTDLRFVGASPAPIITKFEEIKTNRDGVIYDGMERYVFGFIFIGDDVAAGAGINLNVNEVRSYKWVPYNELEKYLLFKNQLAETKGKIGGVVRNLSRSLSSI